MRYRFGMPMSHSDWVQAALDHAGMKQVDLAKKVDELLGRTHDRSKLNKVVAGTRELRIEEMNAIHAITGYSTAGLALDAEIMSRAGQETALVEQFRRLRPDGQDRLLSLLEAFAEQQGRT